MTPSKFEQINNSADVPAHKDFIDFDGHFRGYADFDEESASFADDKVQSSSADRQMSLIVDSLLTGDDQSQNGSPVGLGFEEESAPKQK